MEGVLKKVLKGIPFNSMIPVYTLFIDESSDYSLLLPGLG